MRVPGQLVCDAGADQEAVRVSRVARPRAQGVEDPRRRAISDGRAEKLLCSGLSGFGKYECRRSITCGLVTDYFVS